MKKLFTMAFVATILFASCKKCQTCTSYIVGPNPNNPSAVKKDTIYSNQKFCGDELNKQMDQNGKYTEAVVGGNKSRYTTIVVCQ